jgi:membrane-bound metal-dependent hydrolase YbcI (DUF457 family)
VFFWFLGVGWAFVWLVFRSPALDYRFVLLGSVLPLGDALLGGPRLLHTLAFAVALLAVVMLATRRRRLRRRRWIGLAIGVFMHLVLDGIWSEAAVFWWPFFGVAFPPGPLPELDHGAVTWLLEAVGLAALVWCWSTFGLADPDRRARFLHTGQLDREVLPS